ncbi:hypothetical protein [Nonomuraea recticatena]|uniref:Uncharacterized protein n=1 Tax=Nonomuraea recticatena TaxID=46178 RepID=A0ABP6FDQ6_9ACTN
MFETDEAIKRALAIADDAARVAARNYVGIDADDISGHIVEKILKNEARYDLHADNERWLWAVMYAEGIAYCNKQVRDFMYYSDEHYYTPAEVRDLLERAYRADFDVTQEFFHSEDASISFIDLFKAFSKLNYRDRDLIARKYAGDRLEDSERRAFYRASEHLAAILNGTIAGNSRARVEHQGPGARKVLTNAAAIHGTRAMEGV